MKMHKSYSYQYSSNCSYAAGAFARKEYHADTAPGVVSVLIAKADPLDRHLVQPVALY